MNSFIQIMFYCVPQNVCNLRLETLEECIAE